MGMSNYQADTRVPPSEVVVQPAATGFFVRTDNEHQDILCRLADGGVYIYNRHQKQEYFVPKALIDAYSG